MTLGLFSYLIAQTYAFFYERRKGTMITVTLFLFIVSLFVSYRYVQAKVNETDTFSDMYILEKVGTKITLPSGIPHSLVRVENAEKLQKEHFFYKDVKEGHYIIAYPKLFVIYDAVHDEIISVKESSQKEE